MITVKSGTTNTLTFLDKYNQIDYYEIRNQSTNEIYSGTTMINGDGGKIIFSGLTYNFEKNNLYTFQSFYDFENIHYLGSTHILKCGEHNEISENIQPIIKPKTSFKIKK